MHDGRVEVSTGLDEPADKLDIVVGDGGGQAIGTLRTSKRSENDNERPGWRSETNLLLLARIDIGTSLDQQAGKIIPVEKGRVKGLANERAVIKSRADRS